MLRRSMKPVALIVPGAPSGARSKSTATGSAARRAAARAQGAQRYAVARRDDLGELVLIDSVPYDSRPVPTVVPARVHPGTRPVRPIMAAGRTVRRQ